MVQIPSQDFRDGVPVIAHDVWHESQMRFELNEIVIDLFGYLRSGPNDETDCFQDFILEREPTDTGWYQAGIQGFWTDPNNLSEEAHYSLMLRRHPQDELNTVLYVKTVDRDLMVDLHTLGMQGLAAGSEIDEIVESIWQRAVDLGVEISKNSKFKLGN